MVSGSPSVNAGRTRKRSRAGPEPRQPPSASAQTQMKAVKLLGIAALFAMAFSSSLACSDDNDDIVPGIDVHDAAPPGAAGGAWPGTCDPVRQDCPAGQQCTGGCNVMGVMAKVFTCAVPSADATATHGEDCGAGCAPGHDCYLVRTSTGETRSVCRKYCNVDADCPTTCGVDGLVCSADDMSPIGRLCAL
jgi:hypothetical protein